MDSYKKHRQWEQRVEAVASQLEDDIWDAKLDNKVGEPLWDYADYMWKLYKKIAEVLAEHEWREFISHKAS